MEAVYILGTESAWSNNELRYSLRSLRSHVSGIDHIYIVGADPGFITPGRGVTLVPHEDNYSLTKERRIAEKVLYACDHAVGGVAGGGSDFFFVNDDMFFTAPVYAESYPNYYKGTLLNSAKKRPNDRYKAALINCHNALSERGRSTLNFDTHTPIVYNRRVFKEVIESFNWRVKHGMVVKSLYANSIGSEGVFMPDCKIDAPMTLSAIKNKIADRHVFSVGDNGLTDVMKKFLQDMYPEPGLWEITS